MVCLPHHSSFPPDSFSTRDRLTGAPRVSTSSVLDLSSQWHVRCFMACNLAKSISWKEMSQSHRVAPPGSCRGRSLVHEGPALALLLLQETTYSSGSQKSNSSIETASRCKQDLSVLEVDR